MAIQKKHAARKKGVVHTMTVVEVAIPDDNKETFIEVIFHESQRVYKLPKDANPAYLKLLKESEHNHTPVLLERVKEASDVIVSVRKAG